MARKAAYGLTKTEPRRCSSQGSRAAAETTGGDAMAEAELKNAAACPRRQDRRGGELALHRSARVGQQKERWTISNRRRGVSEREDAVPTEVDQKL